MKKSIYKQKKFWLLLTVFVAFWMYSLSSYITFNDNNYVGPITEFTENSITVDDGRVGPTSIQYDQTTPIFSRDGGVLELGTPVFVGTLKNQNSNVILQAKFIRIIPTQKPFLKKLLGN